MNDRTERKLQQVALASYNYRHEAEFAAGWLDDAGIPYRLQIEDPTLGLSATNAATLWVSAMDERRARRVLEHEMTAEDENDRAWAESRIDGGDDALEGRPHGAGEGSFDVPRPIIDMYGNVKPDLPLRQRGLSLVGSVGVGSLLALDAVRSAPDWVALVVAGLAVGLALVAVFGRAPGPLRTLLSVLSGDAP